ncbi:MAG TPA: hypothetical protein VGK63_08000 [Candidatus Limnocylindrales bacterium]
MDLGMIAPAAIVAIAAGLACVGVATRLGGRLRGSFGSGFVGFRGDGWPHGVQEDDDARWRWGRSPAVAPERKWRAPSPPVPPTAPQRH